MIQRRVTVLCLMSWSPRVAHAHYARIPRLSELRARALFVTVDVSIRRERVWRFQIPAYAASD